MQVHPFALLDCARCRADDYAVLDDVLTRSDGRDGNLVTMVDGLLSDNLLFSRGAADYDRSRLGR